MARRRKGKLFGNKGGRAAVLRRVALWVAVFFAAVVLLSVAAWYQALNYLQSNDFRDTLGEILRSSTGASQLRLQSPLRIDGERVTEEGLELNAAGSVRVAHADRLRLELNRMALLSRELHIRKLSIEDGDITFCTGKEATEAENAPSASAPIALPPASKKSGKKKAEKADEAAPQAPPRKGSEPQESRFRLRSYAVDAIECKNIDLVWKHSGQEFRLNGSSLTAEPGTKGGWQLLFENGRVHSPFTALRDASLKTASLSYGKATTDLNDSRIMLTPGELRLKGHRDNRSGKWSGVMTLNKADVRRLLSEDWSKKLTGELFARLNLNGDAAGLSTADGTLSLQQGVLEGLPFLSELPAEGGYPYRTIELEKADCRITYPYRDPEHGIRDAWMFDKINIAAKDGKLLAKGHVIISSDGSLGGTITLGLPESAFPGGGEHALLRKVFTGTGEAGYLWLNINLSGTISEPEQDLDVRLRSLLPGVPSGNAGDIIRGFLTPSPDKKDSKAPTAPTPGKVIDGVINTGLRTLF